MKAPRPTGDKRIDAALLETLRRVSERSTPVRVATSTSEFTVRHDLGVIPAGFGYTPWGNFTVWATEANRRKWTDKLIVLTASADADADVWAEV
jgi:hypothetical protein